ncbi:MAG TPA: RtcB family protein, partial [Thermoanaerobaculia bacterium]|nr:RtcB family protein [Thermoanaerobaculia bacterium]
RVAEIYDAAAARAFGLRREQVTVMIHSGSRGLGHQVCTDHLKGMLGAASRYGIELPDRQLACAPLASPEGRRYLGGMAAAANFAFANRQVMTHWVRESFARVLATPVDQLGIEVVYDVCHNIAKLETFDIGGERRRACVHRKGATRAYPPGHAQVPHPYREAGQPVLIPGDMGRYSYVLAGTQKAYEQTFGSACHGAGRRMSRGEAKKQARGRNLLDELAAKGVVVMAAGMATVAEEMPEAYKDVADVVDVVVRAGIARKVARLEPIGVIKG